MSIGFLDYLKRKRDITVLTSSNLNETAVHVLVFRKVNLFR